MIQKTTINVMCNKCEARAHGIVGKRHRHCSGNNVAAKIWGNQKRRFHIPAKQRGIWITAPVE